MRRLLLPSLAFLAVACGGAMPAPQAPNDVERMETTRIVATQEEGELRLDAYTAEELFRAALDRMRAGRCADAVVLYDRIEVEFPESRFVTPALYNAGLCQLETDALEGAAAHFQRLLERQSRGDDGRHANLQLLTALSRLERWEDSLRWGDRLLLREDLSLPERQEGLARRAQALLGLERVEDAGRQAEDALRFRRRHGEDAIPEVTFAALANFVLAESFRLRSEAIEIPDAEVEVQHEILEERAGLLLDAQREYFDTIRWGQPEWAGEAGYRIGSLYDRLWHAITNAPIPAPTEPLRGDALETYETEYRLELSRYIRPLLRHAIRFWEMTLMLVERNGIDSEWTERTRADLDRMRGLLLEQMDNGPERGPGAGSTANTDLSTSGSPEAP